VRSALGRRLAPAGIRETVARLDTLLGLSQRFDRVTVVFVPAAEIRELKNRYLGINRATDVLSFPALGPTPDGRRPLGDVVICPEYLEARYRGPALPRRARQLTLHSVLHLLGFDHDQDRGEMKKLENRLRRKLGIG
jgi:probable rRNA maturation factor